MFSACASSQISSIDSYTTFKDNASVGDSVEDLLADMSGSGGDIDISSKSRGSSIRSSRASILDALSFSSDSDELQTSEPATDKKTVGKSKTKVGSLGAGKPCVAVEEEDSSVKPPSVKPRRTRSPMGTYIPPEGGSPLTRSYFSSPGPAAYAPDFSTVKPAVPEVLLKFRHKVPVASYGPGPGAYMAVSACCQKDYFEKHFAKRFQKSDSIGPGPAHYDVRTWRPLGKYTPRALILSRPYKKRLRSSVLWPNLYGWTRYGNSNPPKAILLSKPLVVPKDTPGPGAYDPEKCRDCRIGIKIRGRPDSHLIKNFYPGPQYMLPPTLGGPLWTLIGRHSTTIKSDSPGPIYKSPVEPKKPVSLTFRPFPVKGREEEPSPLHYVGVGEQNIKTKFRASNAIIGDRHYPDFGSWQRPGPNQYFPPKADKIGFSSYNECSLKGRRKQKTYVQPGPADYDVPPVPPSFKSAPNIVISRSCKGRKSCECAGNNVPGCKYTPKMDRGSVRNVFLSSRWKTRKLASDNVPFYDLTGFTPKGKVNRIPISFKSRQSPFVYQGVSTTPCGPPRSICGLASLKYEKPPVPVQTNQSAFKC